MDALCARFYILYETPSCCATHYVRISTSHIYFYPDTRFISSFIWGSFIYDFYLCVYIYIYMSLFVCIFYSVAGHHGRTVWLNGPPCINIFEIKKINVPWTVKDRTRGPALRSGFANGHRVALVVHRARKSVPDSAGEWPTFLPPPLESCSGTVNGDGSNCSHHKVCDKIIHSQTSTVHPLKYGNG